MNLLCQVILVCLVIVALQGLVAVLAIAIVLSLIWGLFFRTEQTVGLIAFSLLITALQAHPVMTIGALVALTGAFLIAGRTKRPKASDPQQIALPAPEDRDR